MLSYWTGPIPELPDGAVVVDAGCNEGYFTKELLARSATRLHVHCFEANPLLCQQAAFCPPSPTRDDPTTPLMLP